MAVERAPGGSSLIDVLDRVLDKGVVIDAWARLSLAGIALASAEARVVADATDADHGDATRAHGAREPGRTDADR